MHPGQAFIHFLFYSSQSLFCSLGSLLPNKLPANPCPGSTFLGGIWWRQGFGMISCFSSTHVLKVIWDLEVGQVALVLPMVWSQKTKLVMSISPLIVVILTTSAKRKEVGKMREGRDMQQSPWQPTSLTAPFQWSAECLPRTMPDNRSNRNRIFVSHPPVASKPCQNLSFAFRRPGILLVLYLKTTFVSFKWLPVL